MHGGRLSGQYGRLSSFTTCWWAGEECRAAVMYGMRWQRAGRDEPPLSAPSSVTFLQPPAISYTSEGGCFFSLGVVVSLSLIRPYSHCFFFFFPLPKTTENNQGWTPDIHLYLHALFCISLLQCSLCRGRIKEILSVHQYLHIQCVLLFCASADVWFVTECTGFGVYLSSKVFTVYLISNTKE